MATGGEHAESYKPVSAISDYTRIMLEASSYLIFSNPFTPFLPLRHLSSMEPYYYTTMTRSPPYAPRCLQDLCNCDSASSRTTSLDAPIRKWNPATIPSRAVEAESAQRQAFRTETHIARSNAYPTLHYGPSVVKDHLLDCPPSENSIVR
jgi:hypothetical protein